MSLEERESKDHGLRLVFARANLNCAYEVLWRIYDDDHGRNLSEHIADLNTAIAAGEAAMNRLYKLRDQAAEESPMIHDSSTEGAAMPVDTTTNDPG